MTGRILFSIVATVVVLVASVAYLARGVLDVSVGTERTTVTITAPASNGLHAGSAVLLRGLPVGTVDEVSYRGKSIHITMSFDAGSQIPVDSMIEIANQSMIGESGVFVTPAPGATGPYLTGGMTLAAHAVDVPASVPELLAATQHLLDQVDPTLVNRLVDTISAALAGTDQAVQRLTPAAQVVAATMIYAQPALVALIGNGTSMLRSGEWIGPSLRPTKQELIFAGQSMTEVITHVKPFADFTRGGELIGQRWRPTLDRSAKMVPELATAAGTLTATLLPAAQRSGSMLSTLDIASLVEQAMKALPGDGLRLAVTLPK